MTCQAPYAACIDFLSFLLKLTCRKRNCNEHTVWDDSHDNSSRSQDETYDDQQQQQTTWWTGGCRRHMIRVITWLQGAWRRWVVQRVSSMSICITIHTCSTSNRFVIEICNYHIAGHILSTLSWRVSAKNLAKTERQTACHDCACRQKLYY